MVLIWARNDEYDYIEKAKAYCKAKWPQWKAIPCNIEQYEKPDLRGGKVRVVIAGRWHRLINDYRAYGVQAEVWVPGMEAVKATSRMVPPVITPEVIPEGMMAVHLQSIEPYKDKPNYSAMTNRKLADLCEERNITPTKADNITTRGLTKADYIRCLEEAE